MTATRAVTAALALLLAGCAAQLRPAPTAHLVAGRGRGAEASDAGVRVVARAGAWQARPAGLDTTVTPVLVTIDNGSGRRVRVRYADFALVAPTGQRFAALDPFEVRGSVSEPVAAYAFPRFGWGPRLVGVSRRRPIYLYDPFFWDPFYPGFVRVDLPTGDMVQLALRETVVEPGTSASGFLYFERPGRGVERLDFTAQLVDAGTGEEFGSVTIPFVLD